MENKTQNFPIKNRKSIFTELKGFCTFARDNDFMETTLWSNGLGFDVRINSVDKSLFSMTFGEFEALKKLIKQLEKA